MLLYNVDNNNPSTELPHTKFINIIVKFSAMKHPYQWLILKLAICKSSH